MREGCNNSPSANWHSVRGGEIEELKGKRKRKPLFCHIKSFMLRCGGHHHLWNIFLGKG